MGCLVLLVIVVGLPTLEMMVMGRVAAQIGFWDTAFLLILSAVFGSYLAKYQGKVVLLKVQQCLGEGRVPTLEMVDGLLIFLGGLLFIFPGFVSDVLGVLLVFPLTRWVVRWFVIAGLRIQVNDARRFQRQKPSFEPQRPAGLDKGGAVDAEVIE